MRKIFPAIFISSVALETEKGPGRVIGALCGHWVASFVRMTNLIYDFQPPAGSNRGVCLRVPFNWIVCQAHWEISNHKTVQAVTWGTPWVGSVRSSFLFKRIASLSRAASEDRISSICVSRDLICFRSPANSAFNSGRRVATESREN